MRHGWSVRLVGLVPASLIAACLVTPATDGPLPAEQPASAGAELAAGYQERGTTSPAAGAIPATPTAGDAPGEAEAAADWTGDCLTQLRRLERAGREGRLTADDRPPIAVVLVSGAQGWLDAPPRQPVDADLPLEVYDGAPPAAVRCAVRIGPAQGQTSAYRAVDLQDVQSVYQSGLRRERNPAYDVAERKLRQARRDARGGDHDIVSVGDPLLDLVGLAVGSVINAFDSRSSRNQIAEARAELASLPRSSEEPVYRPYVFERYVVRAQKQAVVPVALLDAAGRTLRSADLRQSERRELFMLRGLDPRDRDYEQHRTSSMTRAELARWTRTPPALRLSSVAAALIDGAAVAVGAPPAAPVAPTVPPLPEGVPDPGPGLEPPELKVPELEGEWLTVDLEDAGSAPASGPPRDLYDPPDDALEDPADQSPSDSIHAGLGEVDEPRPDDLGTLAPAQKVGEAGGVALDLADLKSGIEPSWDVGRDDSLRDGGEADLAVSGPHPAGVVGIRVGYGSDAGVGHGFYVREHLVLTAYDVVRDASVVDVVLADGAMVPALVASVDPAQGLALIQVPRPGPAVVLHQGGDPPAVPPLGADAGAPGRPLLVDGQVVGMTTRAGERTKVVAVGAIRAFLDDRAGTIPTF